MTPLPRLTGCPHCQRSIRLKEGEVSCPVCGKLVVAPEFRVYSEAGRFGVELVWPGKPTEEDTEDQET